MVVQKHSFLNRLSRLRTPLTFLGCAMNTVGSVRRHGRADRIPRSFVKDEEGALGGLTERHDTRCRVKVLTPVKIADQRYSLASSSSCISRGRCHKE